MWLEVKDGNGPRWFCVVLEGISTGDLRVVDDWESDVDRPGLPASILEYIDALGGADGVLLQCVVREGDTTSFLVHREASLLQLKRYVRVDAVLDDLPL